MVDLNKLFEMQRKLDQHILEEHPELKDQDNLDWKTLALLVEISECANEWRGFKKWSKNQQPRTYKEELCSTCGGGGTPYGIPSESGVDCYECEGAGFIVRNPLLEEYVDGLHFTLSLGLEIDFDYESWEIGNEQFHNVTEHFLGLKKSVLDFSRKSNEMYYVDMLEIFIGLGYMLDFTWEQIEQAYIKKNEVNHARQDGGY